MVVGSNPTASFFGPQNLAANGEIHREKVSFVVWQLHLSGVTPMNIDGVRGGFLRLRRYYGGIPERPKGPDCKSGGYAFTGSNPVPAIFFRSLCILR